ncbi:STAS domain-containing protein [Actinomadura rubrisoli]|uniref:Anti-sigma factor antagonist n=1 Tax=Actinomadura rubrisoli TaxID=2530368 RepID=A0A4R5AGH6_9ACTN|nr:STAS domain-containing protein [Actinomadura rubrisoli]TDD71521.1 anti-sigma factor antagonist [Actinomadura rubrisoli]
MDFTVHQRRYGDHTIVAVGGDIDVETSPRLRDFLLGLVEDGARHLVIDLGRVTFLDSTGLGVMIGVFHRLGAANGSMSFAGGSSAVRGVFHVTQLTKVFALHDTLDQALLPAH